MHQWVAHPTRLIVQLAIVLIFAFVVRLLVQPATPLFNTGASAVARNTVPATGGAIAPFFTPEIQYWGSHIVRWAGQYGGGLDPDLVATVMQIESCGHASISSTAGAQGLFQVMPFHFSTGETMTDPETNARRGVSYLAQCLDMANGDTGRALACYNGGPSVLRRAFGTWAWETQRYYVYGSTIYADAQASMTVSPSVEYWLDVGGAGLCTRAAEHLRVSLPQVG